MRFTKTLKARITGISGILVGIYLLYLNNKFGIIPIIIGLWFLLWRFKK